MNVNEALELSTVIRKRIKELTEMRDKVARIETWENKKIEPAYDVRKVDERIITLQTILFNLSVDIKKTNAVTALISTSKDYEADKKWVFKSI